MYRPGAAAATARLSGLVGGQGNTGVVFGFAISKQTAPLCGFEKSNAERESRGHQRGSRSVLGDAPSGFSERRQGFAAACVCGGSLVRRQNTCPLAQKVKVGKPSGHVCERQD